MSDTATDTAAAAAAAGEGGNAGGDSRPIEQPADIENVLAAPGVDHARATYLAIPFPRHEQPVSAVEFSDWLVRDRRGWSANARPEAPCGLRRASGPGWAMTVPRVGDLIEVPEAHYRYGIGDLRLRVCGLSSAGVVNGWLEVFGAPIEWNGREGETRYARVEVERVTVVRAATTRRAGS